MLYIHQAWLLASCMFFALTPGDALKCRVCKTKDSLSDCDSSKTCEVNAQTGACVFVRVFDGEVIHESELDCIDLGKDIDKNPLTDDNTGIITDSMSENEKLTSKSKFCHEADLCNEELFKAA